MGIHCHVLKQQLINRKKRTERWSSMSFENPESEHLNPLFLVSCFFFVVDQHRAPSYLLVGSHNQNESNDFRGEPFWLNVSDDAVRLMVMSTRASPCRNTAAAVNRNHGEEDGSGYPWRSFPGVSI